MTIFGWDMSHYDWDRGLTATEIRAAAGQGIAFMTHKIGEGTGYTDPRFDDFWRATRGLAGAVLLGAYYVVHPGNQQTQADRFLSLLDSLAAGWRNKAFILQVDAEKFDYMPREPNLGEIKAFVARLRAKAPQFRPIVYAPRWLYGDTLRGLGSPLWASNYGDNPARPFRTAYPGDGSSRWSAYSGQTPAILQYGSRAQISTQATCDANAFRGTLDSLRVLVYPQGADEVTPEDISRIKKAVVGDGGIQQMIARVEALFSLRPEITLGDGRIETNQLAAKLIALATSGSRTQVDAAAVADAVVAALPAEDARDVADLVMARLAAAGRTSGNAPDGQA